MKNKIFVGLAIIIIIGTIVIATLGFNVDTSYKAYNLVEVKIGQEFNISDIQAIANEVFSNSKVEVEKAGGYNEYAIIRVKNIDDEQKNSLNTKINQKYGTENTTENISVNYIPREKVTDVAKPYVVPVLLAGILVLIYMAIRFRKLGFVKVISQAVVLTGIAEALYFSIIAITRYPVNRLVMPVALVIYITILTVLTGNFEKQNSKELEK
ncbi:MAG: hypothetical protein IKD76_00545 [Clostridia bacterium]|nr:hypothetical protein [Clostridia bacterium]